MLTLFWIGAFIAVTYITYRIGEWMIEEKPARKEELRNLIVTYSSKDMTLPDFDKVLKEINNKIVTSCKEPAGLICRPIKIKDVVDISTITSGETVQFVVWYKCKSARKKSKPYNPYVFGDNYTNRNY